MKRWLISLAAVPLAGVLGLALYAGSRHSVAIFALGLLIAAGAWVSGGLLGFLFGIPRSIGSGEARSDEPIVYRSNTNLEQISDWLTKILVGLGLVELGTIVRKGSDFVDFLAPALGGQQSGSAFALATLVLFGVSGFLALYLVTRVYVGVLFARTEQSLATFVAEKVQETQQAQDEKDVRALALVSRQLEPEPDAPPIAQDTLNDAVSAASAVVKTQIFERSRQQRRRAYAGDVQAMERTIPVFLALIAADTADRFHRNHAQLAYALKDKQPPDYARSEEELTKAIEIRDRIGDRGFRIYEFNRAYCRIALGRPADAIRADLAAAASRGAWYRQQIETTPLMKNWLDANGLTVDSLV
jgi:hypothetical protein